MSGHSKWATIKRKKAATDAKRGKIFTKLIREITVAARDGGGDPDFNPRLRLGVDNAKAGNMPAENITRAIKKGTGELEGVSYEEITYEGYGPGGIALYIETLTDNQKRTVADVRHILTKLGGSLGTTGSVGWQFDRKGQIYVDASRYTEESVFEAAIEAGAEDVESDDEGHWIYCTGNDLNDVATALEAALGESETAKLIWKPQAPTEIADMETAQKLMKLIETLEDDDDVQNVTGNFDFSDEVATRLEG